MTSNIPHPLSFLLPLMMQVVQYSTSCVFLTCMCSVIQARALNDAHWKHSQMTNPSGPSVFARPRDSTCQLMVSYVLVTPRGLHFSVQFLTQQGPTLLAIPMGLYVWDTFFNPITLHFVFGHTQTLYFGSVVLRSLCVSQVYLKFSCKPH